MPDHVIAVDVVVLEPPAVIEVFNVGVQGPPGPQGPPGEGGEGGGTLTDHAATHEPGGTDPLMVNAAAATGSLRTLGTTATAACAGNDTRLTNARIPTTHATTHQPGGSDALAVDAAAATGSLRTLGTGATQAAPGNDARFTAPSTPTAHAATHTAGNSDPVAVTALAGYPGGTANFLRADGTFAPPPAGGGGGDVTGPASAVDNRIALFNGTTGKLLDAGPDGTIGGSLAIGTNPATIGAVRLANEQAINARNATNTADIVLMVIGSDNNMQLGYGTANGIGLGGNLYCNARHVVGAGAVDAASVTVGTVVAIGSAPPATGAIRTDGALAMAEMTPPAAPAANVAHLFVKDNGSGKTQLMVQFATGAAIQLAIQP